jgi:hypothetical protein
MKVAICTAVWGRWDVWEMFAHFTKELIKDVAPIAELQVFVVGSEGDISREAVTRHGFNYREYSNQFLGRKWNAVVQSAQAWRPDYVLMMGSDDVMDGALFAGYLPYMANGIQYIGVLDWHFFEAATKRAIYWKGYRVKHSAGVTCGAGRMLSADLLDKCRWSPWHPMKLHNLLDTSMEVVFAPLRPSRAAFVTSHTGGMGLDIKSAVNMTPFALWDNTVEVDPEQTIFRHFDKRILCAAYQAAT